MSHKLAPDVVQRLNRIHSWVGRYETLIEPDLLALGVTPEMCAQLRAGFAALLAAVSPSADSNKPPPTAPAA
jgi:hypothetical protein